MPYRRAVGLHLFQQRFHHLDRNSNHLLVGIHFPALLAAHAQHLVIGNVQTDFRQNPQRIAVNTLHFLIAHHIDIS